MANAFVKEEEDSDDRRLNLLDVIEDRNRSLNKVTFLLLVSCMTGIPVVISCRRIYSVSEQGHP